MKGIFGIFLWRFLGTMTCSSSNPQIGLCLKAFSRYIKGLAFSETDDAAVLKEAWENMSEDWLYEKFDALEKSPR